MNWPEPIEEIDGVKILTPIQHSFEDLYIAVRNTENRVLSDAEVASLPNLPQTHQHHSEWRLRQASTKMVLAHFHKHNFKTALDLGCGNGWFTNMVSGIAENVIGIDMNVEELKQAARVFGSEKIRFAYGDVFTANIEKGSFGLITVNACFQYFPEPEKLIRRLLDLLAPNGEIHLVDTPLYRPEEVLAAAERSENYYSKIGHPKMAEHYFHHSWEVLQSFNHKVMFNPKTIGNRLKGKLGATQPAFPWVIITK